MLNQKVQNVELNIVDPSHVSLKQRVEEKKGGKKYTFSCGVSLLFHPVAKLSKQHFSHTNWWRNATSATNGTTWCKKKKKKGI